MKKRLGLGKTKTAVIKTTTVWTKSRGKIVIAKGSKVELLPRKKSTPDGAMGTCLSSLSYVLLLGTIGVRGPYTVSEILKASNGQVLLCFIAKGKEVRLRSIYFRSAK